MAFFKSKNGSGHPLSWVPTVYFAMGLPFVVLNMVAAVMFKNLEVPNAQIAFWTSLIMWPWTIKFLWSPFLEIFKTKKFFVVSTQIVSGALFGLAALALHIPDCFAVMIALFAVIAFSGASHDIAADGVYMSELSSKHQSQYIGWQGAFYNLAKLVATGGLVGLAGILARHFSGSDSPQRTHYIDAWMIVLAAIGLLLLLLGILHSRAVPCKAAAVTGKSATMREGLGKLREVIAAFFTKRYIWYYIAFIILYRLGEGFVMKIVPLFLMSDRSEGGLGLSNEEIGLYYGSFGSAAFLIGSLLAGYFIARRGLKKSIFTLCCIFNIPFIAYALLAWFQPSQIWITAGAIAVEYFGYGFGFVGLTLFMMQQVAPGKHQMAHYAFASGIMNFSVMLTGAISGYISDALGYNWFFTAVMVATVPAFVMTWFIPFSHPDTAESDNTKIESDYDPNSENNDPSPAGYAMGGETAGKQ
jgi:PAT family beta-lactamase induction signal transducer AmpG